MKKLSLICLLAAVVCTGARAQAPEYKWVRQLAGADIDQGNAIATDAEGNVYTAGQFRGNIDLDPGITLLSFTSLGNFDVFVTKMNAAGELVWAKSFGGTGYDVVTAMKLDSEGNIHLTGYFSNTVDFDPNAGTTNITVAGGQDIYVSKLDNDGNLIWAKSMGGTGFSDEPGDLEVGSDGSVYVSGSFVTTADFDPGPETYNLTVAAFRDAFVSKLDAEGNFVWAKAVAGDGDDYGQAITLDAEDNIYMTGTFQGTADFDGGPDVHEVNAAGFLDGYICKLTADGGLVWVKTMESDFMCWGYDIKQDDSGHIYTTGFFSTVADFDPGPEEAMFTAPGDEYNGFISKMDTAGNFIWAKHLAGAFQVMGKCIALDHAGGLYLLGDYAGLVDFDPGAGVQNMTSAGGPDIFILKLTTEGEYEYVNSYGNPSFDFGMQDAGMGVAVSGADSLLITGKFAGLVDFDAGPETHTLNSFSSGQDAFVLKLAPFICAPTDSTMEATACFTYTLNGETYTESGTYTQTFTNAGGCDSTLTINLTIDSIDLDVALATDTLTAAEEGASYQWINCATNTAIEGANGQEYIAEASGDYAVIVTQGSCSDTSACTTVTLIPESIYSNTFADMKLLPNPARDYITVQFGRNLQQASLRIINLAGQVLMVKDNINGNSLPADITSLPAGMYVAELRIGKEVQHMKLVKQ